MSYYTEPISNWFNSQSAAQLVSANFVNSVTNTAVSPDGLPNYGLRSVPQYIAGVNTGNNIININDTRTLPRGFSAYFLDPHLRDPQVQDWNFTIEKEILDSTVLRATYLGNHTTKFCSRAIITTALRLTSGTRCRRRPCRPAPSRIGEHVLDAGQQALQGRAGRLEVGPGGAPCLGQPGLDVAERGDVEEPLEHLAAVLGRGPQEGGEVALGEQHHLGELRHPHAEGVLDDVGDLVVAGAQGDPRLPRRSSSVTWACTDTTPVPRFFGRRNSGERVIRNRRVPAVSSSVTRGTGIRPGVVAAQPALGA